jgi:hypothetical protein
MTTTKKWATYDRGGVPLGTLHAHGPVLPRGSGFFGVDYWSGGDPRADYLHLWTFAPDGWGPLNRPAPCCAGQLSNSCPPGASSFSATAAPASEVPAV